MLKHSIKYVIIIFNRILEHIVFIAVKWIGYSTSSEEISKMIIVTFLCIYFNIGFILMLVNADMTEQGGILGFIDNGSNSDFNMDFF